MNNEFDEVTAVPRRRRRFERQAASGSSKSAGKNGQARNGHAGQSAPRSKRQSSSGSGGGRSRSAEANWFQEEKPRRALPYGGPAPAQEEDGFKLPFDPFRFIAAIKRNWSWILVCACALALLALIFGAFMVKYKVHVDLIRRQSPNAFMGAGHDPFQPREYSDQTLYSFMKSGEVLRRVSQSAATNPVTAILRLTPKDLAKQVDIKQTPNPDLVRVSVSGLAQVNAMVALANMYAQEVIRYTQEIQRLESAEVNAYLKRKLAEADARIAEARENLRSFSSSGIMEFEKEVEADIKRLAELETLLQSRRVELDIVEAQLTAGQEELNKQAPVSRLAQEEAKLQELLTVKGYREAHPEVTRQKAIIENFKKEGGENRDMNVTTALAGHPLFQRLTDLRARKPALEKEISSLTNSIALLHTKLQNSARADKDISYAMAKNHLQSLTATRQMLQQKQEQSEAFTENALGYFRVFSPASSGSVNIAVRWLKIGLLAIAAAVVGLILGAIGVMLVEAMDTKLKTADDVERVTHLPVLATLGDLRKMSPAAQVQWAFRTLTVLKGRLSSDPSEALVCGIISSGHGEGRSTWVNLLVSAASQRGLRVLTVDTRPTSVGPSASAPKTEKKETVQADSTKGTTSEGKAVDPSTVLSEEEEPSSTLTTNVLSTPATVAQQLTDPNSQPVVHIPLPGWIWNLERRKQWKEALEHWRKIDNLVIFVELPPASQQESLLLAEHLPQLIWLTGSGMADAAETAEQLSTLRYARCNLVGAVLNQAPPPVFNNRLARWFTKATTVVALSLTLVSASAQKPSQSEAHRRAVSAARAQLEEAPQEGSGIALPKSRRADQTEPTRSILPASNSAVPENRGVDQEARVEEQTDSIGAAAREETASAEGVEGGLEELTFSGGVRKKKAKWQEKLTLGPGDVFDIHFFGDSALSRTNIFIGPDGRISYLQVQGMMAQGLTIEELRERLDQELGKYYTAPRTIIIPVAFTSKRYYMLGKVAGKGMYIMDRPTTVVEAVARAKGLETGLYQRNSVEMADLSRSFIVRDGEKLPVNLEKLFLEGDLTQNVVLEPDDYLYFESTAVNDIYVLGEVMTPGPIGFVPNATVMTAITDRGGYTERAYKRKVLVVRGSLHQPETFVVDTGAILDARESDFRLQARDIVYVSRRPWAKAEELLDEAAQSFIQGAVTAWAGINAGPILKQKLLPTLK